MQKLMQQLIRYEKMYRRGFISEEERYERVIETWTKTTEDVADALNGKS